MNVNMTQEQLVRELRSGLPIHTHPGDPEPRLSPLSVSCVHAIMSTAANVIETLAADRKSAMQEASEFLKELNDLHAKVPRWISVEERLPEELQYVLAINQYDDDSFEPCIAYFRSGQWFHGNFMGGEITHWMPLPEPPKEE